VKFTSVVTVCAYDACVITEQSSKTAQPRTEAADEAADRERVTRCDSDVELKQSPG
jgi:hypothetical protein